MEPAKLPSLISLVRDRPVKLAGAVALTLATVALVDGLADTAALGWLRDLISKSDVFGPLFFPDSGTIEWKDRLQGIVLLLGLPVAFLLWYWRDRNVRDQIEEQRRQVENARKDTNLKEFLDVRLHAAGAIDPALPAEARQQLQIAALHQLRGFLRGEYGESFRRPAVELLLAGHAAAMEDIEISDIAKCEGNWSDLCQELHKKKSILTPVMNQRILIISDESDSIFESGFSLNNRCFDLIKIQSKSLNDKFISNSSFIFSDFTKCSLQNINFHFTNMAGTYFEQCNLSDGNFCTSDFKHVRISYCNIRGTHFDSDHLTSEKVLFTGSKFSESTRIGDFGVIGLYPEYADRLIKLEAIRAEWG